MNTEALPRRRGELGFSQHEAARLVGLFGSELAMYESGEKMPQDVVAHRLEALLALDKETEYAQGRYLTIPALAVRIKDDVVPSDDRNWGVRLMAQAITDVRHLRKSGDVRLFFTEPSSTGDRRWDAFIAGVAEREAHRKGLEPPSWVYDPTRVLPSFWWLTRSRGLEALAFVHAPAELKVRGCPHRRGQSGVGVTPLNRGRDAIVALLPQLGTRLQRRGVVAEMYLVGGAAMALAYQRDRLTADLDAVFIPKSIVYEEADRIARERSDLQPGWLNDAVKGLLPPREDRGQRVVYADAGLHVSVASPEHLLAMKLQAARTERDSDDILALCQEIGVTSIDEVLDVAERVYGPGRLQPKSQYVVQQLWQITCRNPPHLAMSDRGRKKHSCYSIFGGSSAPLGVGRVGLRSGPAMAGHGWWETTAVPDLLASFCGPLEFL